MAAALTCDQARAALAAALEAQARFALGGAPTRIRDGDRELDFAPNGADIQRAIDRYQRIVDACDGTDTRSTRHAFRVVPD